MSGFRVKGFNSGLRFCLLVYDVFGVLEFRMLNPSTGP